MTSPYCHFCGQQIAIDDLIVRWVTTSRVVKGEVDDDWGTERDQSTERTEQQKPFHRECWDLYQSQGKERKEGISCLGLLGLVLLFGLSVAVGLAIALVVLIALVLHSAH